MIAYTVSAAGANIAVRDLATGVTITLLDDRYATVYWGMAWSPDGQWIAFKGQTRDGTTELAVVHVEGHRQGFRVLFRRRHTRHDRPPAQPQLESRWDPDLGGSDHEGEPGTATLSLGRGGQRTGKAAPGIGAGPLVQRHGLVARWDANRCTN